VAPAGQLRLDPLLQRSQAGLLQPGGLGPSEGSVRQIGQGGAPPQGQCEAQRGRRPVVIPRSRLVPALGQ
jgi:hypothetical protein